MSTRHLVAPDLLALIDQTPATAITNDNLAATRAAMEARFALLQRPATLPKSYLVPPWGVGPAVRVLVYDPPRKSTLRPAVLHIHGGGMISGNAELTVFGSAPIALAMGCVVISVDYRLAPETPFPGALDDCYSALNWAFANAGQLCIDSKLIMVSGDSAGGGLAAALALMNRDVGGHPLAAQLLTYPMLDHRTGGVDDPYNNRIAGEFLWTRQRNQFGWTAYRGSYDFDDSRKGWFSPALAPDLAGLPPAFIATGLLDLFFEECAHYAQRLKSAGVAVDFASYAGAVHGFNAAPDAAASKQFASDFSRAVQRFAVGHAI